MTNTTKQRKALVISLEFAQPLFSGNGIMTQSLVRGLLHLNYKVTVLCARPSNHSNEDIVIDSKDTQDKEQQRMDNNHNLSVLTVDVPPNTWKKLDRHSCFQHLANGAVNAFCQEGNNMKHAIDTSFDYVFAIDWSSIPALDVLKENHILSSSSSTSTIFVFLVFRVFSSSKELCSTEDDYTFYVTREMDAIQKADITFVLSHVDQSSLSKIQNEKKLDDDTSSSSSSILLSTKNLHVHVPPLRNDFYIKCQSIQSSIPSNNNTNLKKYIMCNVRLSPEKNALLFAKMMKGLSEQNVLSSLNLIPIMIGTICDETYAKEVYDTLPPNTVIIHKFLNSEELISILTQTVLMIHPPLYDAFGMTIAEGAAVGVPSLIHYENIGASSLFRVEKDEIIEEDLNSPRLLKNIRHHLESAEKLRLISENAKSRALSWSVKEYAEGMKRYLELHEYN